MKVLEAVCKPLVAFARLQTRRPALGKTTHISSIWAALPALSAPLSLTLGAHPEFTDSFLETALEEREDKS